jgi:hypothetical protein
LAFVAVAAIVAAAAIALVLCGSFRRAGNDIDGTVGVGVEVGIVFGEAGSGVRLDRLAGLA